MATKTAIIGVSMDLGAGRRGVDMGPSAIRCAGLTNELQQLGLEVRDLGDIRAHIPEILEPGNPKLKYLEPIQETVIEAAKKISEVDKEYIMVALGGDHSISLGSVAASAKKYGPLSVLWVDAHGDFNTNESSPSGNIHGMVLAALAGIGAPQLTDIGGFSPKVSADKIVILGARSLDSEEKKLLRSHQVRVYTMHDIDRRGLVSVAQEALEYLLRDGNSLHVSFDIDSVDPSEAPGVGTPVPGGLTYRDAHLTMEMIAETQKMCSLDMVEVNPILDTANKTGQLAVGLIASVFGKRIY